MKAKHTEAPNCLIKQPVNKLAATKQTQVFIAVFTRGCHSLDTIFSDTNSVYIITLYFLLILSNHLHSLFLHTVRLKISNVKGQIGTKSKYIT
jgi:hypothetical protein